MTQGKHPPLYHALAAAAGKLAGGTGDPRWLTRDYRAPWSA
jgi:hypothetical protein